jgi:hypothetical protein
MLFVSRRRADTSGRFALRGSSCPTQVDPLQSLLGRQVTTIQFESFLVTLAREPFLAAMAKARKGFARLARPKLAPRTRISCTLLYPTTASAAFIKESRMKCANATKLHRKFGEPGAPIGLRYEKTVSHLVRFLAPQNRCLLQSVRFRTHSLRMNKLGFARVIFLTDLCRG